MPFQLRDYQQRLADDAIQAITANQRPLIVAPTGSGKSAVLSEITRRLIAINNRPLLVLCHRREILLHLVSSIHKHTGIEPGVISADSTNKINTITNQIIVAMAPTLARRLKQIPDTWVGQIALLCDECHHATSPSWLKLIAAIQPRHLIGTTATPVSCNPTPLGEVFDTLLLGPQPAELVRAGFLAPVKVIAADASKTIDTTGVRTKGGDYVLSDIAAKAQAISGDTVELYKKFNPDNVQTLVACCSLEHSSTTAKEFNKAGILAAAIDGSMGTVQRDQILDDYRAGAINALTFVSMIDEGLDIPEASAIIFARPTKSIRLRRQLEGRVRRVHPGKTHALIIDQTDTWQKLPLPDCEIQWNINCGGETGAKGQRQDPSKEKIVRDDRTGEVVVRRLSAAEFVEIDLRQNPWKIQPQIVQVLEAGGADAARLFSQLRFNKFRRLSTLTALECWPGLTLEILDDVGDRLGFSPEWGLRTYQRAVATQSQRKARAGLHKARAGQLAQAVAAAIDAGELRPGARHRLQLLGMMEPNRAVLLVDSSGVLNPQARRNARGRIYDALKPRLDLDGLEILGLETPAQDEADRLSALFA